MPNEKPSPEVNPALEAQIKILKDNEGVLEEIVDNAIGVARGPQFEVLREFKGFEPEAQLEALRGNEEILDEMSMAVISQHPEFSSFKDPDNCPEGILQDENGPVYIQKACRCTDNKVKALRAVFNEQDDGDGKYYKLRFDSKEFDEETPF